MDARLLLLLCALLPVAATAAEPAAAPAPVVLAADRWCPVNCGATDAQPGYAVEVAREAYAQAGRSVDYRVMPWQRAIEAARAGRIDGIIGTTTDTTPDFVLPREPIGTNANVFYTRAGARWYYRGLATLDGIVVGVANQYMFGEPFDSYVARRRDDPARIHVLYSTDPVPQALSLLQAGRIDAYIDDRMVVAWALRRSGEAAAFREAGETSRVPLYIAFSPARADARALADALDRGLRELRRSGRLARILAGYGLADWAPGSTEP